MKNPEHLGRLVLPLTRRCLNLCNKKKAALPKRRLKPASYPGQFVLSELPEEAWNRVRQREAAQKMAKKSHMISRRKSSVFCDDHGIFRAHEINTSLPTICGPFHQLIATKSGGLFFSQNTGKLSILFTVLFATRDQKKVPSQLDMGRSLYTVFTPVSKASFSLNKMGADFLVSRAIVGLFCLVVRIVGRKITRIIYTVSREKQKKIIAVRSQVNHTSRSPFNNLRIILIFLIAWLLIA